MAAPFCLGLELRLERACVRCCSRHACCFRQYGSCCRHDLGCCSLCVGCTCTMWAITTSVWDVAVSTWAEKPLTLIPTGKDKNEKLR